MNFYVYGLRLKGDKEVRYVGQSQQEPIVRFMNITSMEVGWKYPTLFGEWIKANAEQIEVFKFADCDSRELAKKTEEITIALCLRMNHRLFNRHHVPKQLRAPAGRRGSPFRPLQADEIAA